MLFSFPLDFPVNFPVTGSWQLRQVRARLPPPPGIQQSPPICGSAPESPPTAGLFLFEFLSGWLRPVFQPGKPPFLSARFRRYRFQQAPRYRMPINCLSQWARTYRYFGSNPSSTRCSFQSIGSGRHCLSVSDVRWAGCVPSMTERTMSGARKDR